MASDYFEKNQERFVSIPNTNKKRNEDIPSDVLDLEQLIDFLYRCSRVAVNREISHSLNNFLTLLSIQQSMLMRALQSGNSGNAMKQASKIGDAIKKIEEFTRTLSTEIQITPNLEKAEVNNIITNIVNLIRRLPSFATCAVSLDLGGDSKHDLVDINAIRMALLSFLKISTVHFINPIVTINTNRDSKTGFFYIHAAANEGQYPEGVEDKKEIPTTSGLKLGEIPLRTMQRIIQSLNTNIQIDLAKSGELGFTCIITPLS